MRHRYEREEREREQDGGGYSGPVYDVRGDNNTANISSTNGYRHDSQYNVEELENEFEGRERLWETNAVDASAQLNVRSYAETERDRGAERERERERERGGNKESEGDRDRGGRRSSEGDGDEDSNRDAQRGLSHLHFMDRTHDNTVRAPPNTYEHVPMKVSVSEHHVRHLDSVHSEGNGTQSSRHPYSGGNGTSTSGGMDREEWRGTEKGREGDVMRSGAGKADWGREGNEGRERASREMERNGSIGDGWTDRDNVDSRNNHQHHSQSQSQSQLEVKNVRNNENQYQISSHRYEQHDQRSHNHNGYGRYAEGIVESNNYREGSARSHTMSNITPSVTHHNGSDEQQNYPDQHQIYREEHQKNYNVHQNLRCGRQGGEEWRDVERSEDKEKDGDRGWGVPNNFESRHHTNELKGNSANISPPPPPSYSSSFAAASASSSSSSSLPSSSSSSSRYKSCPTSTTDPLYTSTTSSLNQTERLHGEREIYNALLPGDDSEGEREVGDSDSMRRVVSWTDKIRREKENIKIWEEQMEREIENKQRGKERGRGTCIQKRPDNHEEEEEGEGEEKGGNRCSSGNQYTGTDNGSDSGSGNYGRDNDSTSDSKLHSDRIGYKEELRRLQVCI